MPYDKLLLLIYQIVPNKIYEIKITLNCFLSNDGASSFAGN